MQNEVTGIKDIMKEELKLQREKRREELLVVKVNPPT
jgi:hypothetical protein